jgi:ABC-type transport system involved in cytochrome bd biosynthesis fused ATPase/permease subunit
MTVDIAVAPTALRSVGPIPVAFRRWLTPVSPLTPAGGPAAPARVATPAAGHPRLRVRGLGHPLGLFEGLDFDLPAGRLAALIGPSGVGKTSLFRSLLHGDGRPGSILWDGLPLSDGGRPRLQLALVPQRPALIHNLQVKSLLHYAYRLKTKGTPQARRPGQERHRIDEALRLAGFTWSSQLDREAFRDQFCADLSGGEETRLSLALELLDYPDALLLDEPTSGLDAHASKRVVDALQRLLAEGRVRLVVFITHALDQLRPDDWVVALGTPRPGHKPAHVAYCGPCGAAARGSGIYGALGAADEATLMARLARSRRWEAA